MSEVGSVRFDTRFGVQARFDDIDNALHRSVARRRLGTSVAAEVAETSVGAFVEEEVSPFPWLQLRAGLRLDRFDVAVEDRLSPLPEASATSGTAGSSLASPKLSVSVLPVEGLQLFFNLGRGFHSNDARGAVREEERAKLLAPAFGYELGLRFRYLQMLELRAAAYRLDLDSEQVYIGDAGTTEPSGATRRQGVEASARVGIGPWVAVDGAVTFNQGRFRSAPEGRDAIPLAPVRTLSGGVSLRSAWGSFASLRLRHVGDRPANEDASIQAQGWTILSARVGHRQDAFEASIAMDNLLGTDYREVQFATESRLLGEPEPVEEIHFAPGWPFTLQATLSAYFD